MRRHAAPDRLDAKRLAAAATSAQGWTAHRTTILMPAAGAGALVCLGVSPISASTSHGPRGLWMQRRQLGMDRGLPGYAASGSEGGVEALPGPGGVFGWRDADPKPDHGPILDRTQVPGQERARRVEGTGRERMCATAVVQAGGGTVQDSAPARLDYHHQMRDVWAGVEKADSSAGRDHPIGQHAKAPGSRDALVPLPALSPASGGRVATYGRGPGARARHRPLDSASYTSRHQ